jgi:GNAT superfamily N-acetyltransferase
MTFPLRIPAAAWKSPFRSAVKAWSVLFSDGMALSVMPEIDELVLDRDFADIDRLFDLEEWPFVRADLEISHAQPRAVALVARKNGEFAGFYTAHHFGDVGYLDMSIVAPAFRRRGVGRPLHTRAVREMKKKGIRSFVVHTTNDSAAIIWILGFTRGQTFTLLARDPTGPAGPPVVKLGPSDLEGLVSLDAEVFGVRRDPWIAGLMDQPTTQFYGLRRGGQLAASLCLRARKNGALCLDAANARSFDDLEALVLEIVRAHADRRLECFVRDGAKLDACLRREGFVVPDFFRAIGPVTEWRKGETGQAGRTPLVQCLSWF